MSEYDPLILLNGKFSTLIINDLLDELHGSNFFTKLDLCLGNHQIRIKDIDIPKKKVYTHEGHFDFLVTPFGLYTTLSTFYNLLNNIS